MKKSMFLAAMLILSPRAFASIITKSGNSTDLMQVNGYGEARVVITSDTTRAGFVRVADRYGNGGTFTKEGGQNVGMEDLLFSDPIDGTSLNTNLWESRTNGMTVTQANGYINLNSGAVTTANAYAIVSSVRQFELFHPMPIHLHWMLQSSIMNLPTNTVVEVGIGTVTTNVTASGDGIFYRVMNGSMYAVVSNNGTETQTQISPTPFPLPNANQTYTVAIDMNVESAQFIVNGTLFADIPLPIANASLTNNARNPLFFRVYNTATPPASSPILKIGQAAVVSKNGDGARTWANNAAGMARGAYQGPTVASTFGLVQTSTWTNSLAQSAGTLSNTVASYATLGGQFNFTVPSGAATDYVLFASSAPTGWQLYVDAIKIDGALTTVSGANPIVAVWGAGIGSNAVSLATTEAPPTTYADRKIAFGVWASTAGAVAGWQYNPIDVKFPTPLVVDGGRFFKVILRMLSGTSGVISGTVFINGRYE